MRERLGARTALALALANAEASRAVSRPEAQLLLGARGAELDRLLTLASSIRDEGLAATGRTGVITYSRKVFVPITKLCRDRCHYCIFVDTPGGLAAKGESTFMEPEEILQVARDGAALGCKEALFTLGDRPEDRWPVARQWLAEHGYSSTIEYIRAMAIRVTEETGLLCHLNPGVMSWAELQRLRPVAPSMGMMLETTATRLWSEKGGVHYGSPDKDPALRLRVIDDAGRAKVPFTTGVLLGIGENDAERAEALFAIRASHERFGHVQETIVQNFRAKPRTAMQNEIDLELQEYIAAVAVARLVMGPVATIQAPPNLTDAQELGLLIRAGIDDWGGVSPLTADHVNPERPWPNIDDLASLTRASGYELRERLTAHPPYLADPEIWIDARIRPHLDALTDPATHLAIEDAPVVGRPYVPELSRSVGVRTPLIARAAADPAGLSDADYLALLNADGAELDALAALADDVRRERVGDEITFVANRNLDSALFGPSALSHEKLDALVAEAVQLGATEICLQGAVSAAPGYDYVDLIERIRAQAPALHLHAFRPAEVLDGAARLGLTLEQFLIRLRDAGVGTVPGTGARILDQRIRDVLSGHSDPSVESWADAITTAHRVDLRSTATMVYGHIETPEQQLAHLRRIAQLQDEATTRGHGGFTEFIAMPFVPTEMLLPGGGVVVGARPGPSLRETRAVHAVARLLLAGRIDNVQTAWTKLGLRTAQTLLMGGANDLGGLLLDGVLSPESGAEAYRQLSLADVRHVAAELGRPVRQRTTDYGEPAQPLVVEQFAAPVRMRLPLRAS
ncbi:7,8-didemethyl-8-hydroxy-5-deazariboflavin synthase CofG [Microbacteriaceae bacterium VKM Ac-2854]|nr:7,8-didemethyl-8-hydroxy-5-deazariboflavin synthase CofG [Microbacteriaceae bacterium VKM Ac-2854]